MCNNKTTFLDAICFMAACSVPVLILAIAAFLIFKGVDGWGWFLLVAALVAGSFSFKSNSGKHKCSTEDEG